MAGDSDITLKVKSLLKAYRSHAYKSAKIDPLNITQYDRDTDLDLSTHGLSDSDLTESVNLGSFTNDQSVPLAKIIDKLKATYESSVGYEYKYIGNKAEKLWLEQRIEDDTAPTAEEKGYFNS